jgi:hypothetical protein
MTVLLRILIVLCSLSTAAHFLRFGTLWDATAALFPATAAFFPRLLPRPLLVLAALGGGLLWAGLGMELSSWRINSGLPWMRLALILGAVCLAHLDAMMLMLGGVGKKLFGPVTGTELAKTATALFVGAVLLAAQDKTPFPLLLGARFFPGPALPGRSLDLGSGTGRRFRSHRGAGHGPCLAQVRNHGSLHYLLPHRSG